MVRKINESNGYKSFYEKLQDVWVDIYNLTFKFEDSDNPVYYDYLWECREYIEKALETYNRASDYLESKNKE